MMEVLLSLANFISTQFVIFYNVNDYLQPMLITAATYDRQIAKIQQ